MTLAAVPLTKAEVARKTADAAWDAYYAACVEASARSVTVDRADLLPLCVEAVNAEDRCQKLGT